MTVTLPKKTVTVTAEYNLLKEEIRRQNLHTICQQARCPNIFECFSQKRVTFLILGNTCTRGCRFCAVKKGKPQEVDPEEPVKIARFSKKFGIKYLIITSVCRDDLEDLGGSQFVKVITETKRYVPNIKIETLIPDFRGDVQILKKIISAGPDCISHNLETVPRLSKIIRKGADYHLSLKVLRMIKEISPNMVTKSALLLGMGERKEEVLEAIRDIAATGCDILVLGQYLKPGDNFWEVEKILIPEEFAFYKNYAVKAGFHQVFADTWARSSNCFLG